MTLKEKIANRQECLNYTRVVGWLTPTKNFNKGKAAEWHDRIVYNIDKALK